MKKIALVSIILSLFIISALAVSAQSYQGRFGQIVNSSFVNQLPDPVEPGNIVEVSFRIENLGEQLARDVQVELLPEYPLSVRPGELALKDIGSIESLQKGDDGVIVKYKLVVDANAPDGDHEIRLRYRTKDSESWVKSEPFLVKVQSTNAILSVEKVETNPELIAPGEKAELSLTIKNFASSLLRDIVVTLDFDDVPLNPLGSSNEKVVKQLAAGDSTEVTVDVIADPDAAAKVYKVPATITYKDVLQSEFTKENTLGVLVGDEPDISMTLDDATFFTRGKKGDITIKFVNKGTSDIKFLTIRPQPTSDITFLSSDESYIGNLDSDDFSSADFTVFVEEGEGSIVLPVVAEYKDANNNHYQKTVDLTLPIYSSKEAKRLGLVEQGSGGVWIAIILVLAGLYWWYRRRKKKK